MTLLGSTIVALMCGTNPQYWNVPTGGLVMSEGDGIIRDVMIAINEKWTHNILSDGPSNGYHSTMVEPSLAAGDFLNPQTLQQGPPGPSKAYVAALRHFYGNQLDMGFVAGNGPSTSARNWIAGRPTCNFDYSSGQAEQICKRSHGSGLYSYGVWTNSWYAGDCDPGDEWSPCYGFDLWYQLEQYKRINRIHQGSVYAPGDYYADGMVCSTWTAYLLNRGAGVTVQPYTYSAGAVGNAAWSLHAKMKSRCEAQGGWILNCDKIANQVVNCFCDFDSCDDNSGSWKNTCGSYAQTATSISPDRVIGRNHTGTNSPFAGGAIQGVSFSGSSLYGCWEKAGS